jgi:hypothetical protein
MVGAAASGTVGSAMRAVAMALLAQAAIARQWAGILG